MVEGASIVSAASVAGLKRIKKGVGYSTSEVSDLLLQSVWW